MVRRDFWQGLCGGPDLPVKLLFVALYLAGAVWVWSKQETISAFVEGVEMISPIMLATMTYAVPAYLLMGGVALAVLLVYIPLADGRQKTSCKASALPIMPGWLPTHFVRSGIRTILV